MPQCRQPDDLFGDAGVEQDQGAGVALDDDAAPDVADHARQRRLQRRRPRRS